jgi:competence protein ComFC
LLHLFDVEYCLICAEVLSSSVGWVDLFSASQKKYVCQHCLKQFQRLIGEGCNICGRSLQQLDPQFHQDGRCYDCHRWEEESEFKEVLKKNFSLYAYNEFLKELIAKYKYRGDYILAKIFANEVRQRVKAVNPEFIIPVPLSTERLWERGFNQAEALIVEAGLKPTNVLTRIHSEKQSKKNRTDRIHLTQVFQVHRPISGKVLVVDDIYTTGSTLRHAAMALRQAGAKEIYSLTIARG